MKREEKGWREVGPLWGKSTNSRVSTSFALCFDSVKHLGCLNSWLFVWLHPLKNSHKVFPSKPKLWILFQETLKISWLNILIFIDAASSKNPSMSVLWRQSFCYFIPNRNISATIEWIALNFYTNFSYSTTSDFQWNISTTGCIAMKSCTVNHGFPEDKSQH